jgi:polyisoprenoid-binding protein YceI
MRAAALALSLALSLTPQLFAGAPAHAQAPAPAPAAGEAYSVLADQSSVGYHVVHPLHKVNGKSKAISGKAVITPAGRAQVAISVAADSFDSGNANRDAHVKEVIEAAKHPRVEIKAVADGITVPASFPSTVEKPFKVQVSFHGVQQVIDLPVKVTFESATRVRAQAALQLSLEGFKVERPSLMFKKVDDALKIEADVVFGK